MEQLMRKWIISCDQGIRESLIDRSITRPPLENPEKLVIAPEDAMQIDLVPELPTSGGF